MESFLKKHLVTLSITIASLLCLVSVLLYYDTLGIVIKFLNQSKCEDLFENIRICILGFGDYAVLGFITIFAARSLLVFISVAAMIVLGGSIFGTFYGILYSMISIFISANIAFFISRFANRSFVNNLLKDKLPNIDSKIESHGFKIILGMRFSMIFPFDVLNYTAGLTKVKYRDFILGTTLGMIPEVLLLTFLGENITSPSSPIFICSLSIIALIICVSFFLKKKAIF